MLSEKNIFNSGMEDFFKIYFPTLIVFIFSFNSTFINSPFLAVGTYFLLSGGHVYSTMLEVYADPTEVKKTYVWVTTLLAFLLTVLVLTFMPGHFAFYIFYFTLFHNMRQGLGVTFLAKERGDGKGTYYKYAYYFMTMVPFLILHCKPLVKTGYIGDNILVYYDLFRFFPKETLLLAHKYLLMLYLLGAIGIITTLLMSRKLRVLYAMIFFGSIYGFALIFSQNKFQGYVLMIFSHSIPYFFLMQKRIKKTHSVSWVKKYIYVLLVLFFLVGGILEFSYNPIIERFKEHGFFLRALFTTPIIAHYLFDGFLWKYDNARFKVFVS